MTEEYIVRIVRNSENDDYDCITMGELIRCKDCRYREHMTFSIGDKRWGVNFCGHRRIGGDSVAPEIEESDFCSWAERKDNDTR